MRILSIGNFAYGWDGSVCDEEHIAAALEWAGHEVHRFQRDTTIALWEKYDFVLMAQWDGYGNLIQDLKTINGLTCPIVYWAFDYQADGQEWHERLIAQSDLYLSKRIADSKYPNWQWLSQDFAPKFLSRNQQYAKKDIDVLFTGSYLPWATERNETLKLVDEHFDLHIYTVNPDAWVGFKNIHGPIMDEGLLELIPRAKVVLSIDHTIEAGYWSDRNAQVMACGGFVLFRYVPLSETTFGDKVEYFYNPDDCLKKLAYWVTDDQLRENKAEFGCTYARYNLMVDNRVKNLLTIVEGIL